MDNRRSPWNLGATLYMPATRDDIGDAILEGKIPGLRSLVICLEDAVNEDDIPQALQNLTQLLQVLNAAKAVQAAGATVLGICAIFSYQLPDATRNFAEAGINLTSLTDYDHLINAAVAHGHLPSSELDSVRQWRQDPWQWTGQ
mgnify:CR=1 FL=1